MGQEHTPAAVPGNIKIVEDLSWILAFLPSELEFFPRSGDWFPTGETSNGYHDFLPLIISFVLTIRLLEFLACSTAVWFLCFFLP